MDRSVKYTYYCSEEHGTLKGDSFEALVREVDHHLKSVHHIEKPKDELEKDVRAAMKIESERSM